MSKSIGNVVDPEKLIVGGKDQRVCSQKNLFPCSFAEWMFIGLLQEEPTYGADVLRLWVSSVDYTGDVLIGPQILRQMSDMYRKLRGTMRFLLSNLHDWKVRPCDQTCLHLFSDNKCASNHQGNEWTRSMWRNILLGPGNYFSRCPFDQYFLTVTFAFPLVPFTLSISMCIPFPI